MRTIAWAFLLACSTRTPAPVAWAPDEHAAFERARTEGKGVMIEFYADWAVPSIELDKRLHTEAAAAVFAPSFVPLKIDVTEDSDQLAELRARYTNQTAPDLVFLGADGMVIDRITSLPADEELAAAIRRAATHLRR